MGYSPIFEGIVDSSLWEEPLHVRVLFLTMLAVKDWDHVVRVPDHHLRRKANLTDQQVLDGLKILSEPDRRSALPQPFEGRRIEKVEDGWLVLNGNKYQEAMREANQRARWAKAQREKRARESEMRQMKGPGAIESRQVRAVENGTMRPEEMG